MMSEQATFEDVDFEATKSETKVQMDAVPQPDYQVGRLKYVAKVLQRTVNGRQGSNSVVSARINRTEIKRWDGIRRRADRYARKSPITASLVKQYDDIREVFVASLGCELEETDFFRKSRMLLAIVGSSHQEKYRYKKADK